MGNHPLHLFLEAFVPLRILEYERQGGPAISDLERVKTYAPELGANGDALLYSIKYKTGEMASKLLDAIAVMAFLPGGVTAFDQHWESEMSFRDEQTDLGAKENGNDTNA